VTADERGVPSLQERYAPASVCFGCGPANPLGLRLRSLPGVDGCVATWQPAREHEAFPGVLNGGIISTLLDCHSNWTAAIHLMHARGASRPPVTVTATLSVRLLRPTPSDAPVRLEARAVEIDADGRRVVVEGRLIADGRDAATSRATFVAVGPGHPAYEAWSTDGADVGEPPPGGERPASSASARETSSGR
jgi:acyl-coenzyme A thioesterase PaaI-like protein